MLASVNFGELVLVWIDAESQPNIHFSACFQDLQNVQPFAPLKTQFFSQTKVNIVGDFFVKFDGRFANFC